MLPSAASRFSTPRDSVSFSTVGSIPTPGLSAGYAFDEASGIRAIDTSGNNLTALLSNGATRGPGRYLTALQLDGVDGS